MYHRSMTIGRFVGGIVLVLTAMLPGLSLAGLHGRTVWPLLGWLCVSLTGGFLGGLLLAPNNRIAGALGGMVGAPIGMIALYLYARQRTGLYRAEAVVVFLVASSPGWLVFLVVKLLTDAMFPNERMPPPRPDLEDEDEEDEEPRPRRRRRRYEHDEDE